MPRVPLIRRVLPWLYAMVFAIAAPIVILYTSGYRYNLKKNLVERGGTLITETSPTRADIFLDGTNTGETTPATLQNLAPGWHTIRFVKTGSHDWEKNLEIRTDEVTFTNHAWLWRATTSTPVLPLTDAPLAVSADPNGDRLTVVTTGTTSSHVIVFAPQIGIQHTVLISSSRPLTSSSLRWSDDGQTLLINGWKKDGSASWTNFSSPKTAPLPSAFYHWSGNQLLGNNGREQLTLHPNDDNVTRESLISPVRDRDASFSLEQTTSGLALVDQRVSSRFLVAEKSWRIGDIVSPFVLLTDGLTWLAVQTHQTETPYADQVQGDHPRWLVNTDPPAALFLNRNELWLWRLGTAPTLLWRQSDPIVQAVWHRDGTTVFIATQKNIFTLELDERSGRQVTPLANFQNIADIAVLGKSIYIAGEKDGERALWKLDVE